MAEGRKGLNHLVLSFVFHFIKKAQALGAIVFFTGNCFLEVLCFTLFSLP